MNFQKIVLTIAIILFILVLIFIASILYQDKYGKAYPPTIADCPDYWIDQTKTATNNTDDSQDPESATKTQCINVKNLGKDNCDKTMDFSTENWQGSVGDCRKYKWAKACDLTWDGVTNNTNICN